MQPSTDRLHLLMFRADGAGGVPRTVLNLANAFAERYQVEIISLYRGRDEPLYAIDPRIEVSYLLDGRPRTPKERSHRRLHLSRDSEVADPRHKALDSQPSTTFSSEMDHTVSALTDHVLREKLASLRPGVLISTRPALHAAMAHLAPPHVLTIAQDHMNFEARTRGANRMRWLKEVGDRIDCLALLTAADAADYARVVRNGPLVVDVPNALTWPIAAEPAALTSRTVIAGGRLVEQKGFDRLISAYAPIAESHPDWRLMIYGMGRLQQRLEQQIADLGVGEQVLLPGYSDDFDGELHRASVYAMTSRFEGFPMVLLEAMSKGLPMVSYDCPRGPAEVVADGRNGRLVDDGDAAGFTAALRQLMDDDEARARMGAAAYEDAQQYEVGHIVDRWAELFDRLVARRGAAA